MPLACQRLQGAEHPPSHGSLGEGLVLISSCGSRTAPLCQGR